jgi:hypothetical protein
VRVSDIRRSESVARLPIPYRRCGIHSHVATDLGNMLRSSLGLAESNLPLGKRLNKEVDAACFGCTGECHSKKILRKESKGDQVRSAMAWSMGPPPLHELIYTRRIYPCHNSATAKVSLTNAGLLVVSHCVVCQARNGRVAFG